MKKEINWKAQYVVFEETLPVGITSPSFYPFTKLSRRCCIYRWSSSSYNTAILAPSGALSRLYCH